jgi:hypothetical protein
MWKPRKAMNCASVGMLVLVLCVPSALIAASAGAKSPGTRTSPESNSASSAMSSMRGHMHMTTIRPLLSGDRKRADAVVAAAKAALAPYADYHKALADGFHIFLPNVPQRIYHFTNSRNALEAAFRFDPMKPTSLLYKKTPDGNYQLVGAMYTDGLRATEDELNERIPLSVARWHQHVNFCRAPRGERAEYFGQHPKFGMLGSIHTQDACDAAGGRFIRHVFGWMVHVYPFETDPAKIWSVDDGDGHDNMSHSPMPGMNMN